ncbi:MAG: Flp family type IVb pilin [Anaerolineae bacterium]|nr:Flp family type IVb pilin [Anaerolineae bacterium]MDW8067630.1 Flp family type IVb pilin [Anaerolineae bacterium]
MLYLPREEGQGLAEYGLILVLVAIVVIVILTIMGTRVSHLFSRITSALQ